MLRPVCIAFGILRGFALAIAIGLLASMHMLLKLSPFWSMMTMILSALVFERTFALVIAETGMCFRRCLCPSGAHVEVLHQ